MSMQSARTWSLATAGLLATALMLGAPVSSAQESSLDASRAAAKAAPASLDASLALGRALRRAGRGSEALAELRRGATLFPARAGDGAVRVQWEISRAYVDQRDFGQAMVACRIVGAQTGGAAAGHACAAEAHLLWRRASEALLETAPALAAGNKSYEAKVAEARALALQGKDADAEHGFREAISWKDDAPDAHLALGRFLAAVGKTDAALVELRRAVALDATGPEAAYELGRALPSGPDALAALERAVRERPTYTEAWLKLAELQLSLGHIPEARKAVEAALRGTPQDATAHVVLGRVDLAEGKNDDALTESRTALGILANSAPAKLLAADAYAAKGEIDLALEQFQAASAFDHTDPTPLVHAADACRKAGRNTSARAFGDKATKDFPDWGPGWVAFGEALLADKEPALAKIALAKALQSKGPVDQDAVRAKLGTIK